MDWAGRYRAGGLGRQVGASSIITRSYPSILIEITGTNHLGNFRDFCIIETDNWYTSPEVKGNNHKSVKEADSAANTEMQGKGNER